MTTFSTIFRPLRSQRHQGHVAITIPMLLSLSLLASLLLSQSSLTHAFPHGAPDIACTNLDPSPGHGGSSNNMDAPVPYKISFSSPYYSDVDTLTVNLYGVDGASFTGFIIGAFPTGGIDEQNVGTLVVYSGAESQTICMNAIGNSVTHVDDGKASKTNITLKWTPPPKYSSDIVFRYTIVRGKTTPPAQDYFKDISSTTVKYKPIETEVLESDAQETDVGAIGVNKFKKDPNCGKSKGCYSNCDATGNCDWLLSWQKDPKTDTIVIGMESVFASDNKYVAFGFSDSSKMSKASVVACRSQNGKVDATISFNPGYYNQPVANSSEYLSGVTGSFVDGILKCTVSRNISSSNSLIYDLSKPWFLITARGNLESTGDLAMHAFTDCFHTTDHVNVMTSHMDIPFSGIFPPTTTPSVPPTPGKRFRKDSACGVTKACFSDCDDGLCSFLMAWKKEGTTYKINLKSVFSSTTNKYVAIGFSNAAKMNPASVVDCISDEDNVKTSLSYNGGYSNKALDDPKDGVKLVSSSNNNGVLSCTITRPVPSIDANPHVFDLSKTYYIIAARGDVYGGVKLMHTVTNRYLTNSRVDLSDNSVDISMEESDYPLIKWHGCLMILAWILSASIGVIMARFFKPVWPDTKICGVKVWFAIHRSAMVIAFCLGVTAFIIIFVEVDGYSDIVGEDYKKAHPILGIIVTALLVINPFMSLLRCEADHPHRWLFNWAHFIVGMSAHILSAVTIAIGFYLPKAQADSDTALAILIFYGCWQLLMFCLLSIFDHQVYANDCNRYSTITPTNSDKEENETRWSWIKQRLLGVHVAVIVTVSIYLMYLLIHGKDDDDKAA